jgi:hypothetical protein
VQLWQQASAALSSATSTSVQPHTFRHLQLPHFDQSMGNGRSTRHCLRHYADCKSLQNNRKEVEGRKSPCQIHSRKVACRSCGRPFAHAKACSHHMRSYFVPSKADRSRNRTKHCGTKQSSLRCTVYVFLGTATSEVNLRTEDKELHDAANQYGEVFRHG